MRLLDKLDALVKAIKDDPNVKRFQQLEAIINEDKALNEKYQRLLDAQKKLVNYEHRNDPSLKNAQEEYQKILDKLGEHPLFNEFIDLQKWINDDLLFLQKIIETSVNDKE